MIQCLHWFFGRGASISCNLAWNVPESWNAIPREEKINRIKNAIVNEMESEKIDTTPYRKLLTQLQKRTKENWRNRFLTTNWDCLLEIEINNLKFEVLPNWLADSHVYHINGTVKDYPNQAFGSPFLLEEDKYTQRNWTPEANIIFNHMIWARIFIVIGMSFECETDRFLLESLNQVENDLPIGNSVWIVLNPDEDSLKASSSRIATALPLSKVYTKAIGFNEWLDEGMQPLVELGVFAFQQLR